MNGQSQLEENAQFSVFFFAEQILIFIHVSTPEGGISQGRRVPKCASGILTKKRDRAQGCAPPQKKREKGLFLFSYGPLGGVGSGKGAKEGIVPEGESGFGIIDAFE